MTTRSGAADRLRLRWEERFPGRQSLGAELIRRYDGVIRVYHDTRHLEEVLDAVDLLSDEADDPDVVTLAAWFHDAVYDVRRDDNEELSARLAEAGLPAYDFSDEQIAEVARLVRLTRTHDPEDGDANGAVLSDADLAILATEPARYADYVERVRTEYRHVSELAFRRGRADVLRQLLSLPVLFHTKFGHDRWEAAARVNLLDELATL